MIVSPVLAALRAQTRASHQALEATLAIAAPAAGKREYARYVAALRGWMQPVEAALWQRPWPASMQPARRSAKSGWLDADIAAARADGFDCGLARAADIALPAESAAARFGCAYVIEGSMLGGAFLLRRLGAELAPWPARYLHGYGAEGPQLWRSFIALLAEHVRSPQDIASAVRAADETFLGIGRWLRAHGAA